MSTSARRRLMRDFKVGSSLTGFQLEALVFRPRK